MADTEPGHSSRNTRRWGRKIPPAPPTQQTIRTNGLRRTRRNLPSNPAQFTTHPQNIRWRRSAHHQCRIKAPTLNGNSRPCSVSNRFTSAYVSGAPSFTAQNAIFSASAMNAGCAAHQSLTFRFAASRCLFFSGGTDL